MGKVTVSLLCACFCFCSCLAVCRCPFHVPFALHEMTQCKRGKHGKREQNWSTPLGDQERQSLIVMWGFPTQFPHPTPHHSPLSSTCPDCPEGLPPDSQPLGCPLPSLAWLCSDQAPALQPHLSGALSNFLCAEPALLCSPNS